MRLLSARNPPTSIGGVRLAALGPVTVSAAMFAFDGLSYVSFSVVTVVGIRLVRTDVSIGADYVTAVCRL